MIIELLIICATIIFLFGGITRELARKLDLENDRREIENERFDVNQEQE